jgi:hypothetical protein
MPVTPLRTSQQFDRVRSSCGFAWPADKTLALKRRAALAAIAAAALLAVIWLDLHHEFSARESWVG